MQVGPFIPVSPLPTPDSSTPRPSASEDRVQALHPCHTHPPPSLRMKRPLVPSGAPRTFTLGGGTTERASASFLRGLHFSWAPGRPAPERCMNRKQCQAWRSGGGAAPRKRGCGLERPGRVPDSWIPAPSFRAEVSEVPQGRCLEAPRSHPPCLYCHALPPHCRSVLLYGDTFPSPNSPCRPPAQNQEKSQPLSPPLLKDCDSLNPHPSLCPFQKVPPMGVE